MLTFYSIKNIYSYFEYKKLTKIEGKPMLNTILLLHRQVKQNTQSVSATLGGGQLGYLALVISKEKYDNIPNSTPFERPQDPGQFQVHLPTTDTTMQTPVAPSRQTTRSVIRSTTPTLQDQQTTTTSQSTIIFSAEVATQKTAR